MIDGAPQTRSFGIHSCGETVGGYLCDDQALTHNSTLGRHLRGKNYHSDHCVFFTFPRFSVTWRKPVR
jgi:hypothetical protein